MAYTKYNLESAQELFKEAGCELLVKEYKNTSTPMSYECSCGNQSTIALSDFKKGGRCELPLP